LPQKEGVCMLHEPIPAINIAGILCTLVLSIGIPIAACALARKKMHIDASSVAVGAAAFVIFALLLERILHMIVFKIFPALPLNPLLYALYGGLAAGLFEETGRLVAMKLCMKKSLNKKNSIGYGIGHGGIESVLLVGLTYISNLIIVILISSGRSAWLFRGLDLTARASLEAALSSLLKPGYLFFLAGMERISSIALHICLSYLVYRTVKSGSVSWYIVAVTIHFLTDAAAVLLSGSISLIAFEWLLMGMMILLALIVYRFYKTEADAFPTADPTCQTED